VPLAALFLETLRSARAVRPDAPEPPAEPGPEDGLETTLEALWKAGREAWPDLEVSPEDFVRHLAAPLAAEADPQAALPGLHAGDLYLACGCVRGDPRALSLFQHRVLAPVARDLGRSDALPGLGDDFKQHLVERLLVGGSGGPVPRIAGYSGRGSLVSWVRMAAVRAAINLRGAERHWEPLETSDALALSAAAPDPELTLLRQQCRDEFREAFQAALAELDARARNLLRFHFLQGLSGDAVAGMYGVSRRTVHRWLEQAREALLRRTRERMAERLVVAPRELESIMYELQSELGSAIVQHFDRPET
jgi:RNA polymerase sigma-70 factor, ECF subfamily